MNRAGVAPGAPVVALANAIATMQGVRLVGLMAWESQAVTIADPAEKARVVRDAMALLPPVPSVPQGRPSHRTWSVAAAAARFRTARCSRGLPRSRRAARSSATCMYRERFHLDFPPALHLLACVTSRPTPTRMILDAGKKAMSSDGAVPAPGWACGGSEREVVGGARDVELEAPSDAPAVGDKVLFVVGYGDTTVHLHEEIVAVRRGRIEAVWPVAARGRIK